MTKTERAKLRWLNKTPEEREANRIANTIRQQERRILIHQELNEELPHMAEGNPWKRLDSVLYAFAQASVRLENNSLGLPVVTTDQ